MERVARYIRDIQIVCGQGKKRVLDEEKPVAEKLRRVCDF
jgi:hypothetical protein